MNPKRFLLSLLPWVVFSVIVNRAGATSAGSAAVLAAALSLFLIYRDRAHGVKIIDVTGLVTFGLFAVYAFVAGADGATWVADYGRGAATALVGAVMLGSALFMPFSEQYARETVDQKYWDSPVFHAVNKKISAVWGLILLVMAGGHAVAGYLDPAGPVADGSVNPTGLIGVLFNWVVPVGLVFIGYRATVAITATTDRPAPVSANS